MKKIKEELPVIIEEHKETNISNLEDIKKLINTGKNLLEIKGGNDSQFNSDSFFKEVITQLLSGDNISLKTEYINQNENFAGSKLEFLAKFGNMPYLTDFIKIFETKRVSLGRKSRIELIKAFEKRDEEVNIQNRMQNLKQAFGM